jgi:mannitol PTS system EIIA component
MYLKSLTGQTTDLIAPPVSHSNSPIQILQSDRVPIDPIGVQRRSHRFSPPFRTTKTSDLVMIILTSESVVLRAKAADKSDAIRQAGAVLVKKGCVAPAYVAGMLARELTISTYLGSGVAIPHGELADLRLVAFTGVSVVQIPDGVEWEPGERAYLVIGLASKDHSHAGILSNILYLLQTPEVITELINSSDPMVIVRRLTKSGREAKWN